ncbi:MAG: SAM-dependent methyltransferase, partial [Actinobacteria bacterium]|nr:SAM-dependent methyltransferase [Actinomycetota bacterium]
MARRFAAGDRALLVDAKRRRHLVTLAEGGQFHSHAGVIDHD